MGEIKKVNQKDDKGHPCWTLDLCMTYVYSMTESLARKARFASQIRISTAIVSSGKHGFFNAILGAKPTNC